ncbi:MAG TPA: riboflavin synthase [Acidimicrobiales bacterium]|nr:riboflavin synthase [Acidimicrobiales bacterium]
MGQGVPYLDGGMFTGIVEELGAVSAVEPAGEGARLVISAKVVTQGTRIGDSIAVNGCCLTAVDLGPGWWAADAVAETLARTNLGSLRAGDPVNLERPLAVGDRLGGHLVQGHVDGVGRVVSPAPDLHISAGDGVLAYVVEKGSVTVDGVSLTVVSVLPDGFTVALIPHTMSVTTLGRKLPGDTVNLEADVIAKYTERLLRGGAESPYTAPTPGVSRR